MERTMIEYKVYYRVSVQGRVRLESVFLNEAQEYASSIYRKEKSIADIDEVDRRDRNQK
jgi:hypothetical protein